MWNLEYTHVYRPITEDICIKYTKAQGGLVNRHIFGHPTYTSIHMYPPSPVWYMINYSYVHNYYNYGTLGWLNFRNLNCSALLCWRLCCVGVPLNCLLIWEKRAFRVLWFLYIVKGLFGRVGIGICYDQESIIRKT